MAKKVFVPAGQAIDWFTIAKSDTVNFVDDSTNNPKAYICCSGIFVGTTGDVAIVEASGTVKTFKNIASGQFLPVSAIRINSTNTTASDMLALISQGPQ
jgi:hypothetical protein